VAAWALLIFYFSAQPGLATNWGIWDFILRKMAHIVEFGVLALLLWRALAQHRLPVLAAQSLGGLLALLYAASDEYHQSFVAGRTPAIRDVSIDLIGILLALVVVGAVRHIREARHRFDPAQTP
jgi:VanZ family protein